MKKLGLLPAALAIGTFSCGGPPPLAEGERRPAPSLVLEKVDGSGSFSLAQQKGKVVLVDLWATWCAPCLFELPHLQKLSQAYDPQEFIMVGVVLDSGDVAEIREFIRQRAITYLNLLGQEGTKESFGPFLGYPTKYLIDKQGSIVKKYVGMAGDRLTSDVERLVRGGSLESTE